MNTLQKTAGKIARKRRIRAKISGTSERPRLTVHRSLMQITAQLIDDVSGKTLCSASTKELNVKPNIDGAKKLGAEIAKKAKAAKVETIVFDRNSYKYHGRVQALADAAREAGLTF